MSDGTITTRTLGDSASLGFLATGGSNSAIATPAGTYSAIYAFGDSLSDAGNIQQTTAGLIPASPPYSEGRFSNGPVWVQDLATDLGLPTLRNSLDGGTDFAYGNAETGATPAHRLSPLDLPSQLAQFDVAIPHPAQNALATVWIGANDLFDAFGAARSNPASLFGNIAAAVLNEDRFVMDLAARGLKDILVLTVPDLGKTPSALAEGAFGSAYAAAASAIYNFELVTTLGALAAENGTRVRFLDTYALIDQAVASPQAFGFTDVTTPVWTGGYTNPLSGRLTTTDKGAQDQHLFWDQVHPTEHGHALIASAAANLLGTATA